MPARGCVRHLGVSSEELRFSLRGWSRFWGSGFLGPGSVRLVPALDFGYFLMFSFILGFRRQFLALALTSRWLVFQGWKLICNAVFIGLGNGSKLLGGLLIANLLVVTPPTSPRLRYHCSWCWPSCFVPYHIRTPIADGLRDLLLVSQGINRHNTVLEQVRNGRNLVGVVVRPALAQDQAPVGIVGTTGGLAVH